MTDFQHNESTPYKTRQCTLIMQNIGQSLSHPNSTITEEIHFSKWKQNLKNNALSSHCLQMQAQGILLQVNLKYKQENQNNYPNNLPLICHSQFKNSISKVESVFESFHHLPLPPSSYPYWREKLRKKL